MSSKIPYTYDAGDFVIGYTLGNDIYLYVKDTQKCYSGSINSNTLNKMKKKYNEYKNLGATSPDTIALLTNDLDPIIYALTRTSYKNEKNETKIGLKGSNKKIINNGNLANTNTLELIKPSKSNFLNDYNLSYGVYDNAGNFHANRRRTIINIISDCLNEKFNQQNSFAKLLGVTYNFSLPDIPQDEWINSINDISVLAFVQGIPIGTAKGIYFNNYALGGSQIVQKDYFYGDRDTMLYHRAGCHRIDSHSTTGKVTFDDVINGKVDDKIVIYVDRQEAMDNRLCWMSRLCL